MYVDKLSAGWANSLSGEISTVVRGAGGTGEPLGLFIKELLCNVVALNSVSAGARALLSRFLLLRV